MVTDAVRSELCRATCCRDTPESPEGDPRCSVIGVQSEQGGVQSALESCTDEYRKRATTPEENLAVGEEHSHSRYPLVGEDTDDFRGIVYLPTITNHFGTS